MEEIIKIFGIEIDNLSLDEVMEILKKELDKEGLFTIATPNTEIAMEGKNNKEYVNLINSFDLVVPDGIGLIYASKMRNLPLKERVTGFDISINLLKLGKEKPLDLYILGGKPGVSKKASENIEKEYPGISVVGHRNGYFNIEEEESIVFEINKTKPDIIFVGLGFPKQEDFIRRNKDKLEGKVIIGNGGVTDILAGENKRAPEIFIKLNLEWFYRLLQEPSRITRQIAIPKFIFNVLVNKNSVMRGEDNER